MAADLPDFGDIESDTGSILSWREYMIDLSYAAYNTCIEWTIWLLDSASAKFTFDDLSMLMTLFVLFGDSIKLMSTTKHYDYSFTVMNSICFVFFCAEFLLSTWVKSTIFSWNPFEYSGYLFNFFWWLDLASIVSMFPDINWIADGIGIGSISDGGVTGNAQITKAGRVARLVRLVRLVRLYRISTEKRKKKRKEAELMEMVNNGEIGFDEIEKYRTLYESRSSQLGTMLSSAITKKVIVLVLVLLIVLPLIQYAPDNAGPDFMFSLLEECYLNQNISNAEMAAMLKAFVNITSKSSISTPLIVFEAKPTYEDYLIDRHSLYSGLRDTSLITFTSNYTSPNRHGPLLLEAVFSYNEIVRISAEYSIILIIFIGILLVLGSAVIQNDAETLVITPIERMMNMVEAVSKDPLTPLQFSTIDSNDAGQYETKLLESTVEKITTLLRVGFGEAGAGIIKSNLSLSNTSSVINPLIEGIRVYAIVGFCDIHNFEEVNRRLKQNVLVFVNTIAHIVHSSVHHWAGQCNKNLGNAFVIIWRIGDEDTLLASTLGAVRPAQRASNMDLPSLQSSSGSPSMRAKESHRNSPGVEMLASRSARAGSTAESVSISEATDMNERLARRKAAGHVIDLKKVPGIDLIADQALIAYLKIIVEINRNVNILNYRNDPLLTNNGESEFKVRMGFGLHAGWAIEGAVGSIYKVDATYLSPHVNMAARLETSSRQYGVPLLASHFLYEILSTEAQSKCRKLDIVTVKGSEVPIGIYTYDCLQDQMFSVHADMHVGLAYNTGSKQVQSSNIRRLTSKSKRNFEKGTSGKSKGTASNKSPTTPRSDPSGSPSSALGSSSSSAAIGQSNLFNGYAPVPTIADPPHTPNTKVVPMDDVDREVAAIQSNRPRVGSQSKFSTPTGTIDESNRRRDSDNSAHSNDLARAIDSRRRSSQGSENDAISVEISQSMPLQDIYPKQLDGDAAGSNLSHQPILDITQEGAPTPEPKDTLATATLVPSPPQGANPYSEQSLQDMPVSASALENAVNTQDPGLVFESDEDLLKLRAHISAAFTESFDTGIQFYIHGDWPSARLHLEESNQLMRGILKEAYGVYDDSLGDGPSQVLLEYMGERDWTAPADWKGFRPLTSK